jgi:hypothetical protein|tara:strand:- start:14 stop:562 length:549 start_codon:yes stop_codon:yes gene_type:complete
MGLVYIASATASASATLSFTSGIDATYNEYQFHFVNIHAATDSTYFGFQFNADGASGFDEAIISTAFKAEHDEADSATGFGYNGSQDQATTDGNGTYQHLTYDMEVANDEAYSGVLTLYAPSSTTYVKHFVANGNYVHHSGKYSQNFFTAGYINAEEAIDEISFKMDSGNIDAGTIHMYGVG